MKINLDKIEIENADSPKVIKKSVKAEALRYVKELKLPVIPLCPHDHYKMSEQHKEKCKSAGKAPVLNDWSSRDDTSEREIHLWFNKNPKYNIGLVLGKTKYWNLVGIDIDGDIGEKLLDEFSFGDVPETWEYMTGNGRRLLYQLPYHLETKKYKKASENGELALICSGQQTVLPPSIHHTGNVYRWVDGRSPDDVPIADAPEWIIRLIAKDTHAVHELSHFTNEELSEKVTGDEFTQKYGEGERNNQLTRLAGTLIARRNIPIDVVKSMIWQTNIEHCEPPLTRDETDAIIDSVYDIELRKQEERERQQKKRKEGIQPVPFAEMFIKHQSKKGYFWKYIVHRGRFYVYDKADPVWKPVDDMYLHQPIMKELLEHDPIFGTMKNVREITEVLKIVLACEDSDHIFDMNLQIDKPYVFLSNGVLDTTTMQLKKWRPDFHSTIKLSASWNEDAIDSEEYTLWNNTLEEWIPDEDTRLFLQEFIGYTLTPDCSMRSAVFLFGQGRNGKSLFIDIVSKLYSDHISTMSIQRIASRFGTANLLDQLVNICSDIDPSYMKETSILKALIAGDPISGEYKHGKTFEFVPVAKLIFSANELPKTGDKTEGWYSRWYIVNFPKTFEVNPKYKHDLLRALGTDKALSSILYWAVEGLKRLQKNGKFTMSASMEEAKKEYMTENDNVAGFMSATILEQEDIRFVIPTEEAYHVYKYWCSLDGSRPLGRNSFIKRMQTLGLSKQRVRPKKGDKAKMCFMYVTWNPEEDSVKVAIEESRIESALRIVT